MTQSPAAWSGLCAVWTVHRAVRPAARWITRRHHPGRGTGVRRGVERLSQEWSLQPYQVSLAWLLSRPAVASVIVGAETVEEVTANATAANVKLEQAQVDALTALRAGDDDS